MIRLASARWWCPFLILASAVGCVRGGAHIPQPRQILLISFDTLRADYLGPWREDPTRWEATPNLDAFARRAVVFKNALTASTSTTRAHKSILYGLYNHTHRTAMKSFPVRERVTAPVEVLRRSGLQTTAMMCIGGINEKVGVTHGFDETVWRGCVARGGANDLPGLRRASFPWLARHAQREFLLLLHTYRTHAPYYPDAETLRRVGERNGLSNDWSPPRRILRRWARHWERFAGAPAQMRVLRSLYEAEVEMADHWFGKLVRQLKRLGMYESAVVIVLSDHGESLGEQGDVGHSQMADEQAFVPLMIKVPGAMAREVSAPVGLVDVMPTLFDLMGLEPPYEFEGDSLVPLLNGSSRWPDDRLRIVEHDTRVSLYRGPWKLRFDRSHAGSEVLTLRAQDGVAAQPPSAERRERVTRDLLRMYGAALEEAQPLAEDFVLDSTKPVEYSAKTLNQLQALGYLD